MRALALLALLPTVAFGQARLSNSTSSVSLISMLSAGQLTWPDGNKISDDGTNVTVTGTLVSNAASGASAFGCFNIGCRYGTGAGYFAGDASGNTLLSHGLILGNNTSAGKITIPDTDATGTPGAATINKGAGRVAVASGASSVVVTDNVVSTSSIVFAVLQDHGDATLSVIQVVPASGSFTIYLSGATTAARKVGFIVFN